MESRFRERTAHEEGTTLFLGKTVLASHIEYKKGNCSQGRQPKPALRNEFLLKVKYLSIEGVFLGENPVMIM